MLSPCSPEPSHGVRSPESAELPSPETILAETTILVSCRPLLDGDTRIRLPEQPLPDVHRSGVPPEPEPWGGNDTKNPVRERGERVSGHGQAMKETGKIGAARKVEGIKTN